MDPRLYMLAGTFALLIIALAATIVSVVRASRRAPRRSSEPVAEPGDWPALPPGPMQPIDTSLEGMEFREPEDGPTAALLAPLRTGDWQPSEEPALVAGLSDLSLEARIASFRESAPVDESSVRESDVASSVQPAPVAAAFPAQVVVSPPDQPHVPVAPVWISRIPEVDAAPMQPVSVQAPVVPTVDPYAGDVLAQLEASLEPTPQWVPPVVPEVVSEPAEEMLASAGSADLSPAPAPEPTPAPAPAPPVPAPAPAPEPAPAPAPAPEPPPVPAALPSVEPESHPAPIPPTVVVAGAAEVPALPDAPPASDVFWESMFGDQADPPAAVATQVAVPLSAPAIQPAPPPAQTVASLPRPAPAPVPQAVPIPAPQEPRVVATRIAPSRPPRPKTVVRSMAADARPPVRAVPLEPLAQSQPAVDSTLGRSKLDEIVMAAPVEMWFGESRIGVKAGTKTYAQFRKYADVLFADLRDAKGRS